MYAKSLNLGTDGPGMKAHYGAQNSLEDVLTAMYMVKKNDAETWANVAPENVTETGDTLFRTAPGKSQFEALKGRMSEADFNKKVGEVYAGDLAPVSQELIDQFNTMTESELRNHMGDLRTKIAAAIEGYDSLRNGYGEAYLELARNRQEDIKAGKALTERFEANKDRMDAFEAAMDGARSVEDLKAILAAEDVNVGAVEHQLLQLLTRAKAGDFKVHLAYP